MTNEQDTTGHVASADDKITALATATVALVIITLVAFGPAALHLIEFAATDIQRAAVVAWNFQKAIAIRIGDGTAWLVTLQWL